MSKNKALLKAKAEKNDEFYTQLEDIEAELCHYKEFLKGKVVYLPCDDPRRSQFVRYFMEHFEELELKQLIATCYDAAFSQLSLFEDYDATGQLMVKPKEAYRLLMQEVGQDPTLEACLKLKGNSLSVLEGNGDFHSKECVELMKKADVVITNPPFSLFRSLLGLLTKLEKNVILLGSAQAIAYTEAFQLFQLKKLHLGVTPFYNSLWFEVPEGSPYDKLEDGKTFKKVPIAWLTSFELPVSRPHLKLTQAYDPSRHHLLDDDDTIINVDSVADIPKDAQGKLAVPITFLRVWNPKDYQILGKVDKAMVSGKEKFTRLIIQKVSKIKSSKEKKED